MTKLPKFFLTVSVTAFAVAFATVSSNNITPAWSVAMTIGAIFLGWFLIAFMLQNEVAQFDEETRLHSEADVAKPKRKFIPQGVDYLEGQVDGIEADKNLVRMVSGVPVYYDLLIIATGAKTAPGQTEGMLGSDWRKRVFDFYTFEGAVALRNALRKFKGGRLVVHICELPIKCPVAPLQLPFLAHWPLARRRLPEKTEVVYVTPAAAP